VNARRRTLEQIMSNEHRTSSTNHPGPRPPGGTSTAGRTVGPAVLITGASRGIGAAMVERLAHEGYQVFAGARTPKRASGVGIVPVEVDVTDAGSIDRAVDLVKGTVGSDGLFALVNNAAVLHAGPLETTPPERIVDELRTNVAGPLLATRAFVPLLRLGRGRVVNIGSINAQLPLPYWATYSASKAALLALSDALRLELAPSEISVTLLTLGAFATDIRARAQAHWTGEPGSRYEQARLAAEHLVAALDGAAGDPGLVADALVAVLAEDPPPAHLAIGAGVDDLLALAAEPAEVRDGALARMLADPDAAVSA